MKQLLLLFVMFFLFPGYLRATEFPVIFVDSSGETIRLNKQPERVVSLVPPVTEMLLRIGAGETLLGITHHSVLPPETAGKEIIGGFLNPDLDRVAAKGLVAVLTGEIEKTKHP
jgi:iron complex transport system substrate-binding protein